MGRYKARLVAKGFTQREGVDYTETFGPVNNFDSIRVVLSVAAAEDMDITQFDVKTAFLYGEISGEIFITQPCGSEDPTQKGLVCRLKKALYGLKQSSRAWNQKFTSFLREFNLHATSADGCVYFSRISPRLIITLFVDDGMVVSKASDRITSILSYIGDAFQITTGYPEVYVGLHITRIREQRILHIDQEHYILAKLQKYGFADSYSVVVPADPASPRDLRIDGALSTEKLDAIFPYQECVGAWQWASAGSRPDISYSISHVG